MGEGAGRELRLGSAGEFQSELLLDPQVDGENGRALSVLLSRGLGPHLTSGLVTAVMCLFVNSLIC